MMKRIEVVPYNPKWSEAFGQEANILKDALGKNAVAIYHVGSTSVPRLCAKPIIDIVAVVKNASLIWDVLEKVGYVGAGELNIPFRLYFKKRNISPIINLHVYEEGNPEIDLNILFRDYLRKHPEALQKYAV